MTAKIRSLDEIRQQGLSALVESLGSVDMVRFLQQFNAGQGYYSKERHHLLDKLTMDDVLNDLKVMRQECEEVGND